MEKRETATIAKQIEISRNGNRVVELDTPPPPRSTGITELGANREEIIELQGVAGKILETKDLGSVSGAGVIGILGAFSGSSFFWFKSRSMEHRRPVDFIACHE